MSIDKRGPRVFTAFVGALRDQAFKFSDAWDNFIAFVSFQAF